MVLKNKVEEENDEYKKELEPECRDKTSSVEESSNFIDKMKIECDCKNVMVKMIKKN